MPPGGLLFGLGAALGWGLVDVVASVVGRRIAPLVIALVAETTGLLIFASAYVATGARMTSDGALAAALFGVIAGVGYVSAFYALRIGPLAVVSPVIAAYGGLSVVLAVIFRGEALTGLQWLGVAIAVTGIVLVALVLDGSGRPRLVGVGVAFAFLANLGYALATVGLAGPTQSMGWLPAMVVSRVANVSAVTVTVIIVMVLLGRGGVGDEARPGAWGRLLPGLLLIGVLDAIATISFSVGLETSETWLVGLTSSFGPALAVVFAVVVLRERLRRQQWLGLGLLVAAVVVLGLPG